MGPQSGSCGYEAGGKYDLVPSLLQWVHSLVAVVIAAQGEQGPGGSGASMGPQSGSCGYPSLRAAC